MTVHHEHERSMTVYYKITLISPMFQVLRNLHTESELFLETA